MSGARANVMTPGLSANEAAARWIVRLDRSELSPQERVAFEAWRADPEHAAAFSRASQALAVFDSAEDMAPYILALRDAALRTLPARRMPLQWAAVLVGLVLTGAGATVIARLGHTPPLTASAAGEGSRSTQATVEPQLAGQTFSTRLGERRTVVLSDGSKLTLNTQSELAVVYTAERRLIRLRRGQALFEVAHNANRPFIVDALDREVTALGTVFEVRVDPGHARIVLAQGRVVVDRIDGRNSAQGRSQTAAVLQPGQQLVFEPGGAQRIASADVASLLRWRDGFVEFNNVPLSSAVAEINRYNSSPLVLKGGETGRLRVSGVFRADDPRGFAETIAQILPIKVRAGTERTTLSMAEDASH